jgi:hypothetical protein
MIAESLEIQFDVGAVPEGLRESLLEQVCCKISSAFSQSGLELRASAKVLPAGGARDDGVVGRVVGKTDSGIPAFLAIERDCNGDLFIGHRLIPFP